MKTVAMISFDGVNEAGTGSATYTQQIVRALASCADINLESGIVLNTQTVSGLHKTGAFLRAASQRRPYELTMMEGPNNDQRLSLAAEADLWVVNGFNTSYFLDQSKPAIPHIYIMHDRHDLLVRAVIKGHSLPKRLLLTALGEQNRCRRHEEAVIRSAVAVIAVSCTDYDYAAAVGAKRVVWIPPSFDTAAIEARDNQTRDAPEIRIGMLGNTAFFPNYEGMRAVVNEAWSRVSDRRISLILAGKGTEKLHEPSCNIMGVGYVPDLSAFWRQIDLLLVPNLSGSGIGVKLCEAIARNVPVLATQQGVRGLPAGIISTLDCVEDIADICNRLNWDWLAGARKLNYTEALRSRFWLPCMQQRVRGLLAEVAGSVLS